MSLCWQLLIMVELEQEMVILHARVGRARARTRVARSAGFSPTQNTSHWRTSPTMFTTTTTASSCHRTLIPISCHPTWLPTPKQATGPVPSSPARGVNTRHPPEQPRVLLLQRVSAVRAVAPVSGVAGGGVPQLPRHGCHGGARGSARGGAAARPHVDQQDQPVAEMAQAWAGTEGGKEGVRQGCLL